MANIVTHCNKRNFRGWVVRTSDIGCFFFKTKKEAELMIKTLMVLWGYKAEDIEIYRR